MFFVCECGLLLVCVCGGCLGFCVVVFGCVVGWLVVCVGVGWLFFCVLWVSFVFLCFVFMLVIELFWGCE